MLRFCADSRREAQQRRLLGKALDVHEDFLKLLMEASRHAAQAEERTSAEGSDASLRRCVLLIVDDDENTVKGLQTALAETGDYEVNGVLTGGEALDFVGRSMFQVALVKDGLPDLPSSMVAKSLRAEASEGIVLLFSHPTDEKPGRADIIETNQSIELIPELTSGDQLVEQIHELRKAFDAKVRERRYLQIFRRDHYDFLRRYVDLRQQIKRTLEAGDK